MNIKTLKKIAKGRTWFLNQKIKKSGKNNFQKYSYFELKDILPYHREISNELQIEAIYDLGHDSAHLYVIDLEQGDDQEPVTFTFPVRRESTSGKVTKDIQDDGAIQTYTKRYLYVQLWDISDADAIDSKDMRNVEKVSPERARELAGELGKLIYEQGGNNRDKKVLMEYLNSQLQSKTITNAEYEAVKKLIDER